MLTAELPRLPRVARDRGWCVLTHRAGLILVGVLLTAVRTWGQTPAGEPPKSFREEISWLAYIENSYVWNLDHMGPHTVNNLRYYDFDTGYTFNIAELSLKKDPSDRYPFGFGLVTTAGIDSQKNHAIGIFRGRDDTFPFRNTEKYDLQEAYGSGRLPVGNGLTLRAGKWATLVGYEVLEAPNDLNFSRSFLYTLGTPYTHVGALLSYPVTDWVSVTVGLIDGWDNAEINHWGRSFIGQFAFSPVKDLTANLNWIEGPEQLTSNHHPRWLVDGVVTWTGLKPFTLGFNLDLAGQSDEPSLVATGRQHTQAYWWGVAGYATYDWTDKLRTALRLEYFADPQGVRNGVTAPGTHLSLGEVTITLQYKIWRGLVGRLEFRHDSASQEVFNPPRYGLPPTSKNQNTLTVDMYYSFF
jgi:hypothetical protein